MSPGGPATALLAMGKSGGDGNRREPCRKCLLSLAASRRLPFGYRPRSRRSAEIVPSSKPDIGSA